MVWQCATCETWHDGAAYHATDAPRDPWGRVARAYLDAKATPRYCTEACRATAEALPDPSTLDGALFYTGQK